MGSAKPGSLGSDFLLLLCQPFHLSPIVCSYDVAEILAVGRRNAGETETHPTRRFVFFRAEGICPGHLSRNIQRVTIGGHDKYPELLFGTEVGSTENECPTGTDIFCLCYGGTLRG
jgi:hypothetical protein